jgi:hypothetical protein
MTAALRTFSPRCGYPARRDLTVLVLGGEPGYGCRDFNPRYGGGQSGRHTSGEDVRKKRRTEITVETHEVTVIREAAKPSLAWCAGCEGEARMISPEEAAAVALTSTRRIYQQVEAGALHFIETQAGALLICFDSLAAHLSGRPPGAQGLRTGRL